MSQSETFLDLHNIQLAIRSRIPHFLLFVLISFTDEESAQLYGFNLEVLMKSVCQIMYEFHDLDYEKERILEIQMTDLALEYANKNMQGGLYYLKKKIVYVAGQNSEQVAIEFEKANDGASLPHVYFFNRNDQKTIVYNGIRIYSGYEVINLCKSETFYSIRDIVEKSYSNEEIRKSISELVDEITSLSDYKLH